MYVWGTPTRSILTRSTAYAGNVTCKVSTRDTQGNEREPKRGKERKKEREKGAREGGRARRDLGSHFRKQTRTEPITGIDSLFMRSTPTT